MKQLHTEIIIKAPAAKIWSILLDFDRYPEWNPFILSIRGRAHLRERLKVTVQPNNSKPMTFKPRVTMYKKERQFAWLGQLIMTGMFDGHHIFEIEPIEDGVCRFIHKEQFSGWLVPMFWRKLEVGTKEGFIAMNEKLKELAEK